MLPSMHALLNQYVNMKTSQRFVAAQRFGEGQVISELSRRKTEYPIQKLFVPLHYLESADMLNILALEVCGFIHHLIFLFTTSPLENLEESLKEVSLSLPTSDVFVFQDLIINLRLERGLSKTLLQ